MSDANDQDEDEGEDDAPEGDITQEDLERATRMGWSPADKFRGDPDKWVDADVFLKRGDENIGILRERLDKSDQRAAKNEAALAAAQQTIAGFTVWASKSEDKQYERALQTLRAEQMAARNDGDADRVASIGDQITEAKLDKARGTGAPRAAPPPDAGDIPQESQDFVNRNASWWATDMDMQQYAIRMHEEIGRNSPTLTLAKNLELVEDKVRARYPEKFDNPRRGRRTTTTPAGDIDGPVDGLPGEGRAFKDLPADARRECDRFVKEIPGFTRKDYVRDYEWE